MRSVPIATAWLICGIAAALSGCEEELSVPNPRNCVTSGLPCAEGWSCNPETEACEPIPQQQQDSPCSPCPAGSESCLPRCFVIGQPDGESNLNVSYGLYTPWAARLFRDQSAGGVTKLAVADWENARVLIWNEVPTRNRPADVVLGQQDLMTTSAGRSYGPQSAGSMNSPWSIASDGTRLLIADRYWNRVAVFDSIPIRSGGSSLISPSMFLGQLDFRRTQVNAGQGGVFSLGFNQPVIFLEDGPAHRFFVSDYGNRRVLVYDGIPADWSTPPTWELGQPDFNSGDARDATAGLGYLGYGSAYGLFSDGQQLFLADEGRQRVLVYNLPIKQNDPTPDLVIGQPDLFSIFRNRGGAPGPDTLWGPSDVAVTNTDGVRRLWVTDAYNHRVLRYTLPSTSADLVLGQASFTDNLANRGELPGARGLWIPRTVSTDGVHLVVAEQKNLRVSVWNQLPTENGQPSDFVLGQPSASVRVSNMAPAVHGLQFRQPASVSSDGQRLFVADTGHHRVLIWSRIPEDGATPPDVVLGQADALGFQPNAGGLSASSMNGPQDVRFDGTRLAVADSGNNRVLIWNQLPTQDFAPADAVLGQAELNQGGPGCAAQRLNGPQALLFYGSSLLVSDTANNRVLRFDAPLSTGVAATLAFGQADLLASEANGGADAPTARGLSHPGALTSDAGRILISDLNNSRVLIWNAMPSAHFQPADVVVGQSSFTDAAPAAAPLLQLQSAFGLHADSGRLYVASFFSNRVLIWNRIPTENGVPADAVLGQSSASTFAPNDPTLAPMDRLSAPSGLATAGDRLFIADRHNNRVISRPLPSF